MIERSVSGRELIESGYGLDVERALEHGRSRAVPVADACGFLRDAVPMRFRG
jgi:hypothetical protein